MIERKAMALVLMSGGLDSTTLLHYIVKELKYSHVIAVGFDYGQKHIRELEFAEEQCKNLRISFYRLNISSVFTGKTALTSDELNIPKQAEGKQHLTVVSLRNTAFLVLAAKWLMDENIVSWEDGVDIFYCPTKEDFKSYVDCREDFIAAISQALVKGSGGFIRGVFAPFVGMWKKDIVKLGVWLGVDYSKTYSCYKGGEKQCGVCDACVGRLNALKEGGYKNG